MATSYTNPDGSGNRTATITVVSAGLGGEVGPGGTGPFLVNGNTTSSAGWFGGNNRIDFLFLTPKIIDEVKFYQEDATTHGVWKWQGSNDASTFVDIGGTFTLGGSALQVQTTLAGNTTAYTQYRLQKVSGATSTGPYIYEFEFKIDGPEEPEIVFDPDEAPIGLTWIEFIDSDGALHVWSNLALPDPATYFGGFKEHRVIEFGVIRRGLSNIDGQYEGIVWGWTLSG